MEDFVPNLFTKVVLLKDVEVPPLFGSTVTLEIDAAYTIGKSIAVLKDETIIGHVDKRAVRVVKRFINTGAKLEAEIYQKIGTWENEAWYSIVTHSFEVGVRVRFREMSREDGKLLLAHITKRKLNACPGVMTRKCPKELKPLVRPIKDENGVSTLLHSIHMA